MKKSDITPEMILNRDVEIQIYAMIHNEDGSSSLAGLLTPSPDPDFYDVSLHPTHEGVRGDGTLDPIEEYEDLTLEKAKEVRDTLVSQLPGISVDWV